MYIIRNIINKYVRKVDCWIEENNYNHMTTALKEILNEDKVEEKIE